MRHYLLKRLLLLPPTLFGILLIAFIMTRFVPGGPLEQALEAKRAAAEKRGGRIGGDSGSGSLSKEESDRLKELYGFDRPAVPSFFEWLGAIPKELSPKSNVIFAPGETGEKTVTLEVPVAVARMDADNPGESVTENIPFSFEAKVNLDSGYNASVRLPGDLARTVRTWAMAHNADSAPVERRARAALDSWHAEVARPDYENPTGLKWLRSLFLKNDGAPAENEPVRVRVFRTGFSGILQGEFGDSFVHSRPVLEVIRSKMNVSLWFGLCSTAIAYLISIPLGMRKAIKHEKLFDSASSFVLFFLYAIPPLVWGTVLVFLFAFGLHWFPHSGFTSPNLPADASAFTVWLDKAHHMVLPLIAMTAGQLAFMTMLMKNSLMDNLSADYVRTAIAKGIPFRKAVRRHAFRNSLVPLATSFGNNISIIFTGSFIIERIFDIDGFGLLSFNSLVSRDYPVFMANLLFGAILLLVGNILSDICVALVDPRIRFDK